MKEHELQALEFNVGLTSQVTGIKFEGETLQDKKEFVRKHMNQRKEGVSQLLTEMYDEYKVINDIKE